MLDREEKESRLRIFERKLLRRIYGRRRDQQTGVYGAEDITMSGDRMTKNSIKNDPAKKSFIAFKNTQTTYVIIFVLCHNLTC